MGRLTLADLQTEIQDFLPAKGASKITRIGNKALREIYGEVGPIARSAFNLAAPKTAGTVEVTQDSAQVDGTGTDFVDTENGGLIQIEGEATWFPVTAVVNTTQLGMKATWPGASASGLTYTLVQPSVVLPAAVGEVLDVWLTGQRHLQKAGNELRIDSYGELRSETPRFYTLHNYGTDGRVTISMVNPQDSRYVCTYLYREAPTYFDNGDTASVTTLPPSWEDLVIQLSLYYAFAQEQNFATANNWFAKYKDRLKRIKAARMLGFVDRVQQYGFANPLQVYHGEVLES